MKTKIFKTLAILIAIIVIVWAVTILIVNNDNKPLNITTNGNYAKSYKFDFMSACIDGDETFHNYCECSYNKLYSDVGIIGMNIAYNEYDQTGLFPKVMTDAAESCIGELP